MYKIEIYINRADESVLIATSMDIPHDRIVKKIKGLDEKDILEYLEELLFDLFNHF